MSGKKFARCLLCIAAGWVIALGCSGEAAAAQAAQEAAPAPQRPAPTQTAPSNSRHVPEVPVEGVVRKDADTVVASIPGAEPESREVVSDLELHGFEFDGNAVDTAKLHFKRLSPTAVEITSLAYSLGEWRFLVRDHASYYGLGEHFDVLNRAHTVVKNASQDNGGPKGTSTYKPMPFYMSTSGYGLWLDTTAEATFDMNVSALNEIVVTVPAEKLRIVVFTGPEFPKILEQFTSMTERAILPPYWGFAPWMGRDYHQNESQVQEDVEKTRSLGLPASVIVIDSPWATSYNSYKFNPKQFADAPAMVKRVHDAGYKLVLWHTSWINSRSDPPKEQGFENKLNPHAENYDEAASHGYFVKRPDGTPYVGRWWKGEGSLIDFTNPAAKVWWQDQVRQVIRLNGQEGADGFKDDDAEGSFQGDIRFADGSSPEVMRDRYAVLYNNAMEELIQKDLKGNGVLFARSVTQGANGIGFLWGGDNESSFSTENGLPSVVLAGLNAGMSGMPLWAADLGGYLKTPTTPEASVQARWTEFSAFTPTMEILSSTNLQPWNWDEKTSGGGASSTRLLDLYRKYAVLHMSLFPYRYAAAQQAAKTGMPIMRALPLLYQKDRYARAAKAEYMFGPDMLVAPVVDENTRRPVYLPEGQWVDFWTGASVSGGRTLVVDAPMEVIPVYVRAGAVIPKIPEDVMTLVPPEESGNTQVKSLDERRVYEVFGGAESGETTIKDFEGRVITRSGRGLKIHGEKPAHVIVRVRFAKLREATAGGSAVKVQQIGDASVFEFDCKDDATVSWQ